MAPTAVRYSACPDPGQAILDELLKGCDYAGYVAILRAVRDENHIAFLTGSVLERKKDYTTLDMLIKNEPEHAGFLERQSYLTIQPATKIPIGGERFIPREIKQYPPGNHMPRYLFVLEHDANYKTSPIRLNIYDETVFNELMTPNLAAR